MANNVEPYKINYRSDFSVKMQSDAGWTTPFTLFFFCGNGRTKYYVASYDGTTYTNCHPIDDNWLHVAFDDHALPVGQLKCIITYSLPDPCFPTNVNDETLNVIDVFATDDDELRPVLLDLQGETSPVIQFYLPQLAAEAERQANELERIANETERESNETARQTAEATRQSKEASRQSAEQTRSTNEASRQSAEASRASAEQTRATQEASRQSAESSRASAEQARETKETERQSYETARRTAELQRAANETERQEQESDRDTAETLRQTNESTRQQREIIRVSNEASRQEAEEEREAAETTRQSTFETNEAARQSAATAQRAAEADIFEEKEDERDAAVAVATAITPRVEELEGKVEGIEDGTNPPPVAENLKSWAERSSVEVSDEWDAVPVRTTAGSLSVNTAEGAHLISVRSNGDFTASGFKASPFNLIIASQKVGGVPYILVPACAFGTFGTADENNGILVTNAQGQNKQVSMRFKAFADGVPESVSDGVACPYRDAGGYRFYLPASVGYIWASDMGTTDCAHMAWSKDYDKYEAPSAFSSVSFATIINKFTSIGGAYHMLAIDDKADNFVFDGTKFIYEKVCGYDTSAWTNTAITDEEGTITGYRHEKTISAMASDTKAKDYAGLVELTTSGKVVSYEDNTATSSVAVVYELETHATGNVTIANSYQPNDMGCEYIEGMAGDATIVTTYMQGLPDEVAALPSKFENYKDENDATVEGLCRDVETLSKSKDNLGDVHAKSIDLDELPKVCGYPMFLFGAAAPTVTPDFIGQFFIDTANGKVYMATAVTNSSSFKLLN